MPNTFKSKDGEINVDMTQLLDDDTSSHIDDPTDGSDFEESESSGQEDDQTKTDRQGTGKVPSTPFLPIETPVKLRLAVTIPVQQFAKGSEQDAKSYFSIEALRKDGLGSVAKAIYSLFVALAYTFMYGPDWNNTQLSKRGPPKSKYEDTEDKDEEEEESLSPYKKMIKKINEITANGRFQDGNPRIIMAFEVLVSPSREVTGLRIHIIVTGEEDKESYASKAESMIKELLLHNITAKTGSPNPGYAFRDEFNTIEAVLRAYNKISGQSVPFNKSILDMFSLERDLANFSQLACGPQSDVRNYQTETGICFPFPTLVVPFIPGEISPEKLGTINLYCEEVRVSLTDYKFDTSRPMTNDDIEEVCEMAHVAREDILAGFRNADVQNLDKTEEEQLREASFIEFYKYELEKLRSMHATDPQAVKIMLEKVVRRLLNFHRQDKFKNPALQAMARHLESIDDLFHRGPVVAEDLTPLGNFFVVFADMVHEVWSGTAGQKQELVVLTLFITCLTASDVTDRRESVVPRVHGDASKGKSWAKTLATEFFAEGVVHNTTYESGRADTIPGKDMDGSIQGHDEEPAKMTNKKVDAERVNRFKEVATSGRVNVRRASILDNKKLVVVESVIPMKTVQLITSNESAAMDPAVASRIFDIELDPKTQASHEDSMRCANAAPQLNKEQLKKLQEKFRTITSMVMFYNTLASIGFFPSPPMQLLRDTIEYIDQELEQTSAFNAVRGTMRSLGHMKAIGRVLAVLKGVVEVMWYSEPPSGSRKPTVALFEEISRRVFADAQVTMTTISMFSRKMCSDEMTLVLNELFELRNKARVIMMEDQNFWAFIPNVKGMESLARLVAKRTGLDHTHVMGIIEKLKKVPVPGSDELHLIQSFAFDAPARGGSIAILAGQSDTTRAIQQGEVTGEVIPVDNLSIMSNLAPSPINIAAAFMSGPNCTPRPLVILTTARAVTQDGQALVTPYLATVGLERAGQVRTPPISQRISEHAMGIAEEMLGEPVQTRPLRHSEQHGYEYDIDAHAYQDACLDLEREVPSDWQNFRAVGATQQLGRRSRYQSGEYPARAVAEYRQNYQSARATRRQTGTQSQANSNTQPNLNEDPLPYGWPDPSGASSSRTAEQEEDE